MIWGDWTHPLALVLLGAVVVVVGLISWDRSCGPLAAVGARGIALDKEPRGAIRSTYLATERVLPFASPMKKRLAKKRLTAIFIYADGCSLRLDHLVGDPPPRQVMLRTEARFKDGIVRFHLHAVHRDSGEAWYQEAGTLPTGDEP
jgi:hypothetical protein